MKKVILFATVLLTAGVSAQDVLISRDAAHTGEILSVAVSRDGSMLLSSGADKKAFLWDMKSGEKLKALSSRMPIHFVEFSPGGEFFIVHNDTTKFALVETQSGKPKKIYKEHSGEVTSAVFNPFTGQFATGSKDHTIKIWDEKTTVSVTTLKGHHKAVLALAFSPDGKKLASASDDNTVRIWDAATWQVVKVIEGVKSVSAVAFSPDGKLIATGGSVVTLWDALTGAKTAELGDLKAQVNAVTFSPDAQLVAAAGKDKKVVVWKIASQQVATEFSAHEKEVKDIVFAEKGAVLVSAGAEGTFKIWNLEALGIGLRKYPADAGQPALSTSIVSLSDANANGLIEAGDSAALQFIITNKGKGPAFDVTGLVSAEPAAKGLSFPKEVSIGNIDVDKSVKVNIPLSTTDELENTAGVFTVNIREGNRNNPSPAKFSFQTGGAASYSFVVVTEHSYSSATGKAETGAPIHLKLKLRNISQGQAKNIRVSYLFPDKVFAVNRLFEVIPAIAPGETKEVSVEFYASKEFTQPEVKIGLGMEGCFTNANDLIFKVKMNEPLPVSSIEVAQNTIPEVQEQPVYRGSGDPLKGLNISKPKEMVVGNYYALIIGIDKYKGHWTPLNNAVRDAQAVEALLKEKYKFDHFRKLYNETATRQNIIAELEWLVANVKENDNVFIYYSGHGEYKQALNKGFWVPIDATTPSTSNYISNSDLQTYLGGIKSKHTLLVSDACFSGDIFRGNTVSVPFEESEKYYKEVHALPSRQAMTSGGIEPVMDGGREGHSVFAYYFLKALRENPGRYVDVGQIYNKLKIPVINNSEQSPKLQPVKNTGDEGGQFIFIKK